MKTVPERYLALDVLRGLTVAFMIIVNTPGSWSDIYAPLEHSAWNGCTPTDLVFPSFLFVVGNAMSFSMGKQKQWPAAKFLRKAATRGALIFVIGWLLNAFPFVSYANGAYAVKDFSAIRLWGVLQRIGVCYFLAACLAYFCNIRQLLVTAACILLGYWGLLYWLGDYTLTGNAVIKLDLLYLPVKNIYTHYSVPFEPLGLLSTLPAIVNVIIGYLAGYFLQSGVSSTTAVRKMLLAGAVLIAAGAAWWPVFPVNKALWTSSYVLYASGFDLLLLALLIAITDIYRLRSWSRFFEAFGKNPLFIYILSWVVIVLLGIIHIGGPSIKGWLYSGFTGWLSPKNASLGFALCYMLLMWLAAAWMDTRRWYVKV